MTWRQAVEKIILELMNELIEDGQTLDELLVLKGKEGVAIRDILCLIAGDNCRCAGAFFPVVFWRTRPVICSEEMWKEEPKLTKWRMQG